MDALGCVQYRIEAPSSALQARRPVTEGAIPVSTTAEWQSLALYAAGAAVLLIVLFNIPYVGRALRALFSFALLALCLFVLFRQAPYLPGFAEFSQRLGVNEQEVSGDEVRIRMSPDGHFWAKAEINGVQHRLLVDSGATVTALSQETARQAGVEAGEGLVPMIIRTANGDVRAQTGTIARLRLGGIEARDLKVVVTPALGDIDVLGMNFLRELDSWRVEGSTLILVPKRAEAPKDGPIQFYWHDGKAFRLDGNVLG